MSTSPEQDGYLRVLEEKALVLQKTQTNLKKCPKTRLTTGYLKARLQGVEEHWQSFLIAHEALVKCTPRDMRTNIAYFTNDEFFIYEDMYLYLKADLLDTMNKYEPKANTGEQSSGGESLCTTGETPTCVKLPTIKLPTFCGRYEEFPTYEDLFTTLVHNNSSLSSVQKLHYLKTTVTGEAEILLRHIQTTSANYTQAWNLLKGRYGNKKLITTSLLKRLFNQKKIFNQSATHIKTLMDTTTECLNSLKNQGICIDSWDPMIVFLVVQKLDAQTHKDWEESTICEKTENLPTWDQLRNFMESKFRTLELVHQTPQTQGKEKSYNPKSFYSVTDNEENKGHQCIYCKGQHYIFNCKDFARQPVKERHNFVRNNNLCFNCLVPNHSVFRCKQKTSCRICKRRHHSLLHEDSAQGESDLAAQTTTTNEEKKTETNVIAHCSRQEETKQVLLATAMVDVISSSGESHVFRALIDPGSEASFVTSRIVDLLKLKKTRSNCTVSGIGEDQITIKHNVQLLIKTKSTASMKIHAYVMKTISSNLPAKKMTINWNEIKDITLADPTCCDPNKVDILLGADVYCKIIEEGLLRLQNGLIAQNTTLGWVLSGHIEGKPEKRNHVTSLFVQENNDLLRKFWEIETTSYTKKKILTKEEEECETIYNNTTKRKENGKYVVHLPLKQSVEDTIQQIGDTKQAALTRFKYLERKFEKNTQLKLEYAKVMKEYIDMKHMTKNEDIEEKCTYLPHHAVVREDKDTTKVRVVYDASAKGSKGVSLNDMMMTGPVLQQDLRSIIIAWRKHKICLVGDIIKMYRMVEVTEEHTNLQCILWRNNRDDEIQSYKLQTVTFGTAAAPYLAVRTLTKLAEDEAHKYPQAATVIKTCFYMDDLMAGHDNLLQAKAIYRDVNTVLKRGGFEMQKWSSNSDEFLQYIQKEEEIQQLETTTKKRDNRDKIEIKMDKIIKILGLTWDRIDDTFKITVNLPDMKQPVTKRTILSDVARLFDPFGWLSPVIITAKILIQELWLCNLNWDDELPENIVERWSNYRKSLTYLQSIVVPRWLHTHLTCKKVELFGFSDASTLSYAAVTYLRVVDEEDVVHVTLIASRTKVAPLKQLTVPRLELCAAALLTELIEDVIEVLNVPKESIFAYTDSMVVLAWLQSQPNRWRTFVANRVAEILRVLDNQHWRHIQTTENPADIATRGANPSDLVSMDRWWTGPEWLKSKTIADTTKKIPATELEKKTCTHLKTDTEEKPIWERFSTIIRMKRVLAYCLRMRKRENFTKYLSATELDKVLQICIKCYQKKVYEKEIEDITKNGTVKKRSSLITLSPFLDEKGIMRVGGRLQNANIAASTKNPIIIPKGEHITNLLIHEAHLKTLHGGIQAMLVYIRTRYWIIGAKAAIRKCTRMCTVCVIDKAKVRNQYMGQLPAVRVTPNRAFSNSGVDFAGPVQIRTSKGRGHHATKGYICLFVCMSTRAIHLEAVTDLTTQGFIAAFRRFVSRRGPCYHLWSDNGTNFVGAARELRQMFEAGKANVAREVAELLSNDGTTWHFIPPKMPNYGGLWEAGVQSAKRHLQRINKTSTLTYEEMSTLLAQVEACLNSRPLCVLDDTTETLNTLTPGHFLVGEPIIGVPDINYEHKNMNLLTRWQTIQRMTQDFWHKWQSEYLNTLQQRYKWQTRVPSPCVGDVVVIKEDELPPTKWLLAKILALHPGADGLVRVVSVQCKGNHILKRPLSKLILLPKEPVT